MEMAGRRSARPPHRRRNVKARPTFQIKRFPKNASSDFIGYGVESQHARAADDRTSATFKLIYDRRLVWAPSVQGDSPMARDRLQLGVGVFRILPAGAVQPSWLRINERLPAEDLARDHNVRSVHRICMVGFGRTASTSLRY